MAVDKVILRAFFSTLAAIALLIGFVILALVGIYPSTMMEITYDLGMDASSIKYAERAYEWSNDEYFMAYAMEVAIGSHNSEKIEYCGERLINDEDFAAYCAKENESLPEGVELTYELYVYGQVCVAKYENDKKTEAVERAFEWTVGFPRYNAVAAVLYSAIGDGDEATITMIKGKMEQVQTVTLSAEDEAYFNEVLALVNG